MWMGELHHLCKIGVPCLRISISNAENRKGMPCEGQSSLQAHLWWLEHVPLCAEELRAQPKLFKEGMPG